MFKPLTSGSGEGTSRLPSRPEKPADGHRVKELGGKHDTRRVGSRRRFTVPAQNTDLSAAREGIPTLGSAGFALMGGGLSLR